MARHTPLYEKHLAAGAKMVEFGGWDMPLRYGSQIDEHHQVRQDAGMFDVSHMSIVDLRGDEVRPFLRKLLANDVDRLKDPGKALYTCMLNERGGVLDDLIVYYLTNDWYRLVLNAATHDSDLAWIRKQADGCAMEIDEPANLAMLAVQGPQALEKLCRVLEPALCERMQALPAFMSFMADTLFIARTGYTGEDGFEIILPGETAAGFWDELLAAGVRPIGLGARDSLRLEAGMNLYGADMDEDVSPLESALGWTIAWEPQERDFIGRAALEAGRQAGVRRKLVGLVLEDKGVLRAHQKIIADGGAAGEVTSGGFSPTLGCSIAFARVSAELDGRCKVEIRGQRVAARIVRPPFVRKGKSCID